MKRRTIYAALLFSLLFSMFSASGSAADLKHMHPRVSFDIPISDSIDVSADGELYLTADFKASSDIVINKEISLCLNGFVMDMGAYSIQIGEAGSLTVYDCSENAAGSICSDAVSENALIQNSGSFLLDSGRLCAESRPSLFNKGNANINGGLVTGENADLVQTTGSAVLSVNGGTLDAKGAAAAIRMISDPADETAAKKDYNAGIAGSAVVTAQAGSQGALVVDAKYGRFVINTGAYIKGTGCPAINVLSGNFDAYGGAVVYSDSESAIVGTGGNVSLYNAVITSDEKHGVDISEDAQLLLSGALDINGGMSGVHLADGKLFSMSDNGFYGDVRVSILTDTTPEEGKNVAISTPCDAKHTSHFISANPACSISYENGVIYSTYDGSISHYHDGRNYTLIYDGTLSDLTKNNYYLQSDVSASGFFTGNVVNLCLNGHTLKLSSAIKLYPGSTLNIFDCTGEGSIESNGTCIQDINNGNAKIVLHDGLVLSHGSSAVKLSGDDSVLVKGGEIKSEVEGGCAVEVSGIGNRVEVSGGSISSAASAISAQDAEFTLAGSGSGTISGNTYAIELSGLKPAILQLEGSARLDGGSGDIYLSSSKLLSPLSGFSPEESYSLVSEADGDMPILSVPSQLDHSRSFSSTDSEKTIVCNENNELLLVRSLPLSPTQVQLLPGESASLSVEYTGSSVPAYQWYMCSESGRKAAALEGACDAQYSIPAGLESGEYTLYCVVSDESGIFYSDTALVTVIADSIENVSVIQSSPLSYNGSIRTPIIEASADTTLGNAVRFTFSSDGENYSTAIPPVGPDAGDYVIYYIASADGCDDVKGELTVSIHQVEEEAPAETAKRPSLNINMDARLLALVILLSIFVVLCIIYTIIRLKKLISKK